MASTLNGSLPGDLATRLKRLESRIRRLALLRGLGILAMVLAAGIGVGTLIDLKWELSVGVRTAMLGIVGLCAAGVAIRYLLWPGIAKLSQAELATLVENANPELAERLSSTVELNDPTVPEEHRGSVLMREMLTDEAVSTSTPLDFNQSVSSSRASRFSLTGLAAVLLLLTPFLYSPSGYSLLWQRFFSPWGNFESGGNLYFEVENGNRVVARGTDVVIQAKPKWRRSQEEIPDSVRLDWKDSAGEQDFRRMDFQKDSGVYLTTIPNVFNSFEFDVSAGRARTERFHVSVVEAPTVTSATLDVQPPAYTGMNALHHDGVVGEIPVFRHSGLKFQLQFNKPVEQAELILPETKNVNQPEQDDRKQQPTQLSFVLSADRKSAELETTAETGGLFQFLLTDEHGLHNQQEPRRVLVITPDEAPLIQLAGSDRPRQARPTDTVPVDLLATDDIGVTELELHFEILNGEQVKLTTDPAKLGSREVFHRFDLDLSSLNLKEGDVLTYRVRAADERPVPGPNETWSDPRLLTISRTARSLNSTDVAEMQKELEDTLNAIQDDLKQNREQVTELHKNAENNLKRNQEFQQKEEVTELGQEQFQLAQRLEQLSQNFANHPLYQNLKEKTQEVSRQDLPEASQTIQQAADVFPKERVEKLKQNVDQLRQAENKLNEIAQQFDQLADLERDLLDLNRLADETEQLAQQLKNLENRLGNSPAGESQEQQQAREQQLAQQQQAMQQEQQQLEQQLDDLMDKRPELAEAARQQELQRLAALARQLQQLAESEYQLAEAFREEMQQQGENNNSQPASEQQQNQNHPNPQQQNANQQNSSQPNSQQQNSQQQNQQQQNSNSSQQNQQNANQPNSQQQNQQQQQQSPARQAQARQQELARNAAQLALDVARQLGPESQTAQQAAQTAQQCFTCRGQSSAGRFGQASQTAQQASASAQQAAQQLGQASSSPTSSEAQLQRRAEALAQQQQQLGEQFEQLNQSPQARREGQQAGQQRVALETESLERQLSDIAQNLGAEPLNLNSEGQQAQTAGQSTGQAQQSMQQALSQLSESNPGSASQQAGQASEQLRQAAQQAAIAAGASNQMQSPVPGNIGEQLAEAMRQFAQAQQQMAQAGQQQGQQNGQNQQQGQQQGQQSQGNQPGQNQGQAQSPLSQSAQSLEQAAQALAQAAQQLQSGQNGRSQQGQPQQADGTPGQPGEATGNNATGAQVTVDMQALESALKELSGREWGRLPGKLRTEILQAAQKKPNSDYRKLIKLYFEEIAKTKSSEKAASNR